LASKVLVTGAGGFIGSHLTELLVREGWQVRAFVHYNSASNWYNLERLPPEILDSVETISGDIADSFAVDSAVRGCQTVLHLAALIGIPYSYIAPAAYVSTNVTGTLNVLEACRRNDVETLVHTSTSETYGTAQYVPIDEKHPVVGQSPYSATKIAADSLVESYWRSFDLPACIVRPFNTYGPRQSARAIIPTIIVQALTEGKIKLGNLDPVRDLTYVLDTANGFLAAAKAEKCLGEVINLGVGEGFSIRDLVDRIASLMGKELVVEEEAARVRPEKSEVMRLISDNSKAKRLTGWSPKVDLTAGLEATVDHVERHLEDFKAELYCL
jgi:NAD dependent epimerase/dehydratase